MGDVVALDVSTTLDITPSNILSGALNHDFDSVMVIGWDKAGKFYIASSSGDIGQLLLLLEVAKRETIAQID